MKILEYKNDANASVLFTKWYPFFANWTYYNQIMASVKLLQVFFMKCNFCTKFYTEDFCMHHYVGFLQIRSHTSNLLILCVSIKCIYVHGVF